MDPYGTAPRLYVRRPGSAVEGSFAPVLKVQAEFVVKTVFTDVCRPRYPELTNRTTAITLNYKL